MCFAQTKKAVYVLIDPARWLFQSLAVLDSPWYETRIRTPARIL